MTDDWFGRALERFGEQFDLGEYEQMAYLAVLEAGQLTAAEIADRTDIPQSRVYDTARSLADRGLVELRESRSIQVVAIDPAESFGDPGETLEEIVADLETAYRTEPQSAEGVSLVRSRRSIVHHLEAVVEAADYELVLAIAPAVLDRFQDRLAAVRSAGANVDLLLAPGSSAPPPEDYEYGTVATEVRARAGRTTPVVAVADGEAAIFATNNALRSGDDRYAVVIDRAVLGELVASFFNTVLWSTAEPVYVDDADRSFPRRFASLRRCVRDLERLSGRFAATVAGRDVDSGARCVVRGDVVGVSGADAGSVAAITVATDDGNRVVGGHVAADVDVEAYEIAIDRTAPPDLQHRTE